MTSEPGPATSNIEETTDRDDWAAFRQLDTLTDHWWWRPGWRPDRRYFTWYVLLDGDRALAELVGDCHRDLDVPYLDLAPPAAGLHLTVQGLGFTDDVAHDQGVAVAAAARDACADLGPVTLTVGPAAAYSGGVFLRAAPWAPVQALRQRLRGAIASILGPNVPDEPARFKPHISIAYCNSSVPAADLQARVGRLRQRCAPVQVTVDSVSLIELRREGRSYRWTVDETIRLACEGRHD